MKLSLLSIKPFGHFTLALFMSLMFQGCAMQCGADIQWNSQSQILMSEDSQVKLRSIQTRMFDTTDRAKIMRAAIATMQDLFFDIDVLDEDLGVVSGKKLFNHDNSWGKHPTYYLYKTDELIIFNANFRTWGPFNYRNDLIRITVTIRPKEKTRSLVRASLQYNIRAVEDPYIYQKFFKSLGQSLFLSAKME
ncbi:MAG: hypothetical protein L6263_11025 [Desulfobacteraceae bacterium]|nr:hypothetical protein [Desulfobacteraceae bacterium]